MSSRNERACMLCGIIQTFKKFVDHGCPNCESVIRFQDNEDGQVQECTSPSFEGTVSIGKDSKESWVARWLRIESFCPGIYAIKVNGNLPLSVIEDLKDKNIIYRPRDGSAKD